jgi:non-canonical purine NTP pyrophosphatase (RdgB/HAM1 family)
MDDGLRRRLRRLGVVQGLGGLKPSPLDEQVPPETRPTEGQRDDARAAGLPGGVMQTPHGPFWLLRRTYPAAVVHGSHAFGDLDRIDTEALALMKVPDLGPRPAFLDTETTGLAGGAGTLAFLVGAGVWEGDALVLHLIFMRTPEEELAALHYLTEVLAGATGLVTFNGRGFDVPILESRYILNRLVPTALALPHLDLLAVARQLWRDHLPSRRLGVLETEILQVERTEQDLDSGLIPYLYRQYLETGETFEMRRVFYHNEIDVLSLASLLVHVAQMVVAPEALPLAPGEWAGVGRIYDRAGREAEALAAWRRALAEEGDALDAVCAARLWTEMGLRHKRRGAWEEALSIWDAWMAADPHTIAPLEEEAKYYEWTAHSLEAALACTESALERVAQWPAGAARRDARATLHHRAQRLERRLATMEGGAMEHERRLILATHNEGKRREWAALLDGLDLTVLLPEEAGITVEVEETGDTYVENALLKARALVEASGLPALADDSGLEVDALDGAPGVRSARFHPGSDEVRYVALLAALEGVGEEARGARFRCVAALALPDGRTYTAEGVCEGVIAESPSGEEGFGYDPVFFLPESGKTMAALEFDEKNRISHRARAAQAMRAILAEVLA